MEMRKHRRFSAMGKLEVVVQGGKPQEAYLASIGRGGVGIYLQTPVQPAQLVLINLPLAEEFQGEDELKVVTRVRWSGSAGSLVMAGLSFERMSDARFARLLKHLNVIESLQVAEAPEAPAPKARFTIKE
jgi:hypothetical protein